jgi:hypothetical protein
MPAHLEVSRADDAQFGFPRKTMTAESGLIWWPPASGVLRDRPTVKAW